MLEPFAVQTTTARSRALKHEFQFSPEDFSRARSLIAAYAGISLHERKESMVYNRLARRLRATGTQSFSEYLDWVEAPQSDERERFINALTTNLTAFFREPHHFDLLAARARSQRAQRMRVWSSACSSGEEAYSAAITLREAGCEAEVLGTDIDTDALHAARRGTYKTEALACLGTERLRRNFLKGTAANAHLALVRPEVRAMVQFHFANLLAPDWAPPTQRFDAVFCRNVMIYFDKSTQQRVLDRLAAALAPGALLFVGHADSCAAGHAAFRACGKTAYERRDD